MTKTRKAFVEVANSLAEFPEFVRGVDQDGDLLRIDISVSGSAFNHRDEIGKWFMQSISIPVLMRQELEVAGLPIFRGVDSDGLARAIAVGIDVIPPDHYWWGDDLEKALEYGGDYPNVLIIDPRLAERTSLEVRVDASAEEQQAARQFSAHEPLMSTDGTKLLYSRLPPTDNRRGSPYEFAYAFYIPGNPMEALIGYIRCVPRESVA